MRDKQPSVLTPGQLLAGRYVIIEEIGQGGFGVVYRAMQKDIDRHVAIKTLRTTEHTIPGFDFAESFRKEARHTSKLRHPNTITVHDYGETDDGILYLVMEFLEGETLYERLWRKGQMSPEGTIHISKQIAKSLAEAHDIGIIHGDLKPANIFLCHLYGERDFVKVLDFGITKLIGEVDPAGLGTPEYMSPEQFAGQPLLAASDVYSLGLLMYEMLMGVRPFEDQDTQKLARKHLLTPLPPMPPAIEHSPLGYSIRMACAKEPSNRFENGWATFEALEQISVRLAAGRLLSKPHHMYTASAPAIPVREEDILPHHGAPSSIYGDGTGGRPSMAPPAASRASRGRRRYFSFVGRDQDRNWLREQVVEAASQNIDTLILLGGAAGVGKTRLGQWLIREADLPTRIARGTGTFRDGSPLPLEGFAQALGSALGLPDSSASQSRTPLLFEEGIHKALGRKPNTQERALLDALFGQMIGVEDQIDIRGLADFILHLAARRPLLLHLDNIQDLDSLSLELLEHLSRATPSRRSLLLVCALRREALPAVPKTARRLMSLLDEHPNAFTRTLKEMATEDIQALVTLAFDAEYKAKTIEHKPAEKLLADVALSSQGNPQYAIHLVQHLIDSEQLTEHLRQLVLVDGVDLKATIPPKIAGFFRLRLAQIAHRHPRGREIKHLLVRCAVIGASFPRQLLNGLLTLEHMRGDDRALTILNDLNSLLAILAQEDILAPLFTSANESTLAADVAFAQPLVHQLLFERLCKLPEARHLHGLAALAKTTFFSRNGRLSAYADEIHVHYQSADPSLEALQFYLGASLALLLNGETHRALDFLDHAQQQIDAGANEPALQLQLFVATSSFRLTLGGFDGLEAYLTDALKLARELQDKRAEHILTLQHAQLTRQTGSLNAAENLLQRALDGFMSIHPDPQGLSNDHKIRHPLALLLDEIYLHRDIGLGLVHLELASVQHDRCLFSSSEHHLQQAEAVFDSLSYTWGTAQCTLLKAQHALEAGHSSEALALSKRAETHFTSLVPPISVFSARLIHSITLIQAGRLEDAQPVVDDLLKHFSHTNHKSGESRCYFALAQISMRRGQDDAATSYLERAGEMQRQHNSRRDLINTLLTHTRYLLDNRSNDLEAIQPLLTELMDITRAHKAPFFVLQLQLLFGQLQVNRGDLRDAKDWYRQCINLSEEARASSRAVEAHSLMVQLYRYRNAPIGLQNAVDHLDTAKERASKLDHPVEAYLRAQEIIARAWFLAGTHQRAWRLLDEAASSWRRLGNSREAKRITEILARHRMKVDT